MDEHEKIASEMFPILILVYDRLEKLKECVKSLCASQYDIGSKTLFIASDAANKSIDEEKVEDVRKFAKGIKGFKEVKVLERKQNVGAEMNYALARREIEKLNFKGVILLEDDVIAYPGFISYMDDALIKYYHSEAIQFVSSYLPPGVPMSKNKSLLLRVMTPYGTAIWFHKYKVFEKFKKEMEPIKKWLQNYKNFKKYKKVNPSNVRVLPFIINKKIMPGDILSGIYLLMKDTYALYPRSTLTNCTGFDGSGVHSPKSNKYTHEGPPMLGEACWFSDKPVYDPEIEQGMAAQRAGYFVRIINNLIYIIFFSRYELKLIFMIYEKTFYALKGIKMGLLK